VVTRRAAAAAAVLLSGAAWTGALLAAGPGLEVGSSSARLAAAGVYVVGQRLCHQRPDRSFAWQGRAMPVCARCMGLYAAVPLGACLAAIGRPRLRSAARRRGELSARAMLVAAAVPTIATVGLEVVAGVPITNAVRATTAVPLGATVAWIVAAWAGGDLDAVEAEVN
jgi:uncharacterized membrane protein